MTTNQDPHRRSGGQSSGASPTGNGADPALLETMEWRCIGPFRGGRVVAVAGHPTESQVFYFGACGGGVWRSDDAGTYWENVSDDYFGTAAVGAIAVADSDPNVLYVGTGEACIRGNVSHGDGVYRSTDGGRTWRNVGLQDTRHIARVRVHPQDPDLVYVVALGHAFGPNEQRGVFRSQDGGGTWEKVLFKSERAGAADLSMDPNNPRVLYAAVWETQRKPWMLTSGGPDSGLHKSTDGGDSWTDITSSPGLPEGLKGRIGVAVSPAKGDRVWAIVEAEEGGLYRSDDSGASWEMVSSESGLHQRPWYYSHVFAHPTDPDTVFVLNIRASKSTDGGRTFVEQTMPHNDNHDLWIDPRDPSRMIEGNDGGACVSLNGGATWSTIYNQPTAQFYHVAVDDQFPYRVYGTQQDNSAISVPSRSSRSMIQWTECYPVGNSESGHIAVRPDNPNIVYSGAIGSSPGGGDSLLRYDHYTKQVRTITVWPELYWGWGAKDIKYRFQWTYPIVISPHDPDVLYAGGNVLFRSENEGSSWEVISPDLTRGDRSKMEPSGGPVTLDTTGVEHYGTIFAFAESPREPGVLWAGSDDGLVHVSKNAGRTWDAVTPSQLPEWTLVSMIEPSPHDPATAYIAATRYKFDEGAPLLLKTGDYGATWITITDGIAQGDFTRVIREDPARRGLLYAGTETGVYISHDDGATWRSLRGNLPVVPVHDLVVKGDELVAATHGRSFWVLDDLTLLRQLDQDTSTAEALLFQPSPTYRIAAAMESGRRVGPGKNYHSGLPDVGAHYERKKPDGKVERVLLDAGSNPADGVVVTYHLAQAPEGEITLAFLDSSGELVRELSSVHKDTGAPSRDEPEEPTLPTMVGMNRFVWNMRHADARRVPGDKTVTKGLQGPLALPGTYEVRLRVGDLVLTQTVELLKDPRVSTTQEELAEQMALLTRIRDKLSETTDVISRLRGIRGQVDEWVSRADGEPAWNVVAERATALNDMLSEVEGELIQLKGGGELDRLKFPSRLNGKLAELTSVVASADAAPTRQSHEVFEDLSTRIDTQAQRLQQIMDGEVSEFANLVHELEIPPIVAKPAQ